MAYRHVRTWILEKNVDARAIDVNLVNINAAVVDARDSAYLSLKQKHTARSGVDELSSLWSTCNIVEEQNRPQATRTERSRLNDLV